MVVSMVSQNILKMCVCYNGVTRPVIIEDGAINHQRYTKKILPVALKDGQKLMGEEFAFQQDGAPAHKDQYQGGNDRLEVEKYNKLQKVLQSSSK